MTKKKKILIVIFIVILLIAGIGLYFWLRPKAKDLPVEENEKKVEVISNLNLNWGSDLPVLSDFIKDKDVEGELSIYYQGLLVEEEKIEKFGTYDVEIMVDGTLYTATITVIDEEAPVLTLKTLTIANDKTYEITDFIESCTDNSGQDCKFRFQETEMANYKEVGDYNIVIIAEDENGNEVSEQTKLAITAAKTTTPTKPNNTTTTDKTTSTQNTTTNNTNSITKVDTTTEKNLVEENYQYGIKISTYEVITYDVYSDGSKKETKRVTSYEYDRSTYNATTSDLKAEATAQASKNSAIINEVLTYVNELRREVGASPLILDNNLTIAANVRALEMGYAAKFSHTRPNGNNCFTVLNDLNISYGGAGENIAYGQTSAASVIKTWKNSQGHYDNMVSTSFTKIGIGYFKYNGNPYWVQLFTS